MVKERQRKSKYLRHTAKLLLNDSMAADKQENSDDEVDNLSSDGENTVLPDDRDDVKEEYEY